VLFGIQRLFPWFSAFGKYRTFRLFGNSLEALTKIPANFGAMRRLSFVILVALLAACRYDVEETLYGTNCPDVIETYEGSVRQLLEAHCTGCHSGAFPESGLDLTTYASARQATLEGSLLDVLVLPESNSLSMPPNGALDSCQIALLQNWAVLGAPEF
jgi:hypothetical protein